MDISYKRSLPDFLQNLITSIEEKCGFEISIKIDPLRLSKKKSIRSKLAANIEKNHAEILIPSKNYFPAGSVLHEVLHIHRFLVEDIPQLECSDDLRPNAAFEVFIQGLDNSFEHLAIVPTEISLWPSRKGEWGKILHKTFRDLNICRLPREDIERHVLINWIFVQHALPSNKLIRSATYLIDRFSIKKRATDMTEAVLSNLNQKEVVVDLLITHLALPKNSIQLKYIGH